MSIKITDNFNLNSREFIDNRIKVSSLEALKNWNFETNLIPPGFEVCVVTDQSSSGVWYIYDPTYDDSDTGKFKPRGEGGGGGDAKFATGEKVSDVSLVETKEDITPTSTKLAKSKAIYEALQDKQDTLRSGVNIKKINGIDILGEGDIEIESGKTPYIGADGDWWIGDVDTNVRAEGQSIVHCDLSNQLDAIAMTADGRVSKNETLITYVSVYYGTTPQTIAELTYSEVPEGVTVTTTAATGEVQVDINENTTLIDDKLSITLTARTSFGDMSAVFTVQGVRAGADGDFVVLYQLLPSNSAIKVNKDGIYIPTTLTCQVTKEVGNEPPEIYVGDEVTVKMLIDGGIEKDYEPITTNTTRPTLSVTYKLYRDNVLIDIETVPVLVDGLDGASPYFADLDNEMDSISCDSNGNAHSDYDKYVNVSLWHGSTPLDLTKLTVTLNGTTISSVDTISNITISPDKVNKRVGVHVTRDDFVAERNDLIITLAGENTGDHTLHFILNGVRDGADGSPATIYSLVPSVNSVVKKKDGTYSTDFISCTRQKNVGGVITNDTTDGTITYKIDGGSTENPYTNNTNISVTDFTKSIQFIFRVDSTIVDIETIPLVSDGTDGTSGYMADLDNEMDSIMLNSDGYPSSEQTVQTNVCMWYGSTLLTLSSLNIYDGNESGAEYTNGIIKDGITVTWAPTTGTTINIKFKFSTSNIISDKKTFCIKLNSESAISRYLYFTVNGVRPGANGDPAVMYSLVPSVNSVVKKNDGTYSTDFISCTRQKNVGGVITNDTTDGTITYKIDGGSTENSYTNNTNISVDSFTKSIQFIFRVDSTIVDIETIPLVVDGTDGEPGTSPVIADLDNEMDSIALDTNNNPSSEQTVETNVSLWYGSTKLTLSSLNIYDGNESGAEYTNGKEKEGITVTWDTSTGNIKFKFSTSASITSKKAFCIKLNNESVSSKYLYFTVNGIKPGNDGSPAAIYRLVPSTTQILKTKNGSFVPSGNITCGVTKNVGGKQSTPSSSEYTLNMILNGNPETSYSAVATSSVTTSIIYILYIDGIVVDRETVPLVTDGTEGTSPYFADLDNEMDSIALDTNNNPSSEQTVETNVSLWYGSTKLSPTIRVFKDSESGSEYTSGAIKEGITVTWTSSGNIKCKFSTTATINNKEAFCIKLTSGSISRLLYFTVNGVRPGDDGSPAAIYRLVPSTTQILKTKNGSFVPSGNITCGVTKNVGGEQSTPSASEYTLKMILNGNPETTYSAVATSSVTTSIIYILYVNEIVVDRETVPLVTDGADGAAFQIDLSNEADQFGTDSDSKVLVQQKKSTTVSLYYGTQRQTLTGLTPTLVYEDGKTTVPTTVATVTSDPSTGIVEVTIKVNNTSNTHTAIIVSITATCSIGSRTVLFTLQKVMSGTPGTSPTIYQLAPTQDAFTFSRTSTNDLTPDSRSSKINVLKTIGNTTTLLSSAQSGITYKWGWDESSTAQYTNQDIGTSISVSSTDAKSHNQVWVELNKGDREIIPILRDGINGTSGGNTAIVYLYKRSSNPVTTQNITITLYYKFEKDSNNNQLFTNSDCTVAFTSSTSGGDGWSPTIPSDSTNPIYVIAASAFSSNSYDPISNTEWSDPVQLVDNGGAGLNSATVFLYQRKSSTPYKPSNDLTYTFADGSLSGTYSPWSTKIPTSNGYPCWVTQATAINTEPTDVIKSTEWSTVVKLVEDGEPGTNGDTPLSVFRWNTSSTSAPSISGNAYPPTNWSISAPNRPAGENQYLWMSQSIKNGSTGIIADWGTPVRISGDNGEPGEDASDREYIYKRLTTYPFSGTKPANITKDTSGTTRTAEYIATHDDFVPQGWSDTALTILESEKYVYCSVRTKSSGLNQTWNAFSDPVLWSNWGVQGIDGDGVQYVYKLFDHELTDSERTSNIPTKPASMTGGEWIPEGWSDDPLAPTALLQFCYCSIIKKISGTWASSFEKLGLWSKWANNGVDAFTIDLTNEADQFGTDSDSKVLVQQKRSTKVNLFSGTQLQTPLSDLTATLTYEDGTSVASTVATVTATKSTGIVEVTIKVNNTSNTHTEILANISAACSKGSKSAVFTLQKVMSGTPGTSPIMYQLAPTQDVFTFSRDSSNNLTPTSRSSKINVLKTEGNTTTLLSSAQSGITYNWGWDESTTAQATGQAIGTSITVTSTNAGTHSQVWVELSKGDREIIPIVKNGINGVSVSAQYSTDGSSWHTTFANGDKYMRTSSDNGATWSSAMKIIGENGSETDYSFNISKSLTSTSVITAPSNCYYSTWQDAPKATTTDYPYLWTKIQKKKPDGTADGDATYVRLTGEPGAKGGNTAIAYLYKRSASAISTHGITITLYYKFEKDSNNNQLFTNSDCTTAFTSSTSGGNGWSPTIPSGTNPIYVIAATAFSSNSYDPILKNEWSTPVILAENGEAGLNSATVFLYQRAESAPTTKPTSNLTYTFSSGILSGTLGGWSQTIPAVDGNPCWIIQATAISATSTDTITPSEWGTVRKLIEDGVAGVSSVFESSHTTQWALSNSGTTQPTSWSNTRGVPNQTTRYLWQKDVYEYTAPEYGRNLMRGTEDLNKKGDSSTSWGLGGFFLSGSGGTVTRDTSQTLPIDGVKSSIKIENTNTAQIGFAQGELTLHTGLIIMSCWVKGKSGDKIWLQPAWNSATSQQAGSKSWTLTDSNWKRIWCLGEITTEASTWRIGYVYLQTEGSTIYVTGLKVEYGDTMTEWNKAPEDYNHTDIRVVEVAGLDGTSPYFADLDNEMDSIPCTNAGKATAAYDKYVNVSVWHGTTQESLSTLTATLNGTTISSTGTVSNITITPDKTNKRIRFQVSNGADIAQKNDVTITVASSGSGNKTLHFILNGVRGGAKGEPATIYSLVPSTSSIKRNKSNTLAPASPMTCDVLKVVGDATPTRATSSDGKLRYKVDGDITSSTDGTELTINTGTVSYTSTNTYIVFAFFVGTTMMDKERVPIVYDGADGQNAIRVYLDNEMDSMLYDGGGNKISGNIVSHAHLYNGTTDVTSSATWALTKSGCTISSTTGSTITVTAIDSGVTDATVTATATYNSKTYSAVMSIKKLVETDKYDIIVEPSAIAYNSSTGTSSANSIKATCYKTTVSGRSTSTPPSGYYIVIVGINSSGTATRLGYTNTATYITGTCANSTYKEYVAYIGNNITYTSVTNFLDRETIPVNVSANGTSPYFADLDNEMDSIQTDDKGYPVKAQSVTTTAKLYCGNTARTFKTAVSGYTSGTAKSGVTVTWNNKTTAASSDTITISFATTARFTTGKMDFAITLTDGTDTSVTRTVHFIVNGINGNVYNIVPSVSEIVATCDASGNYLVNDSSTYTMGCKYTKNVDGVKSTYDVADDGTVDGKYYVFRALRRRSDQKWQSYSGGIVYDDTKPRFYYRFTGTSGKNINLNTFDAMEILLCAGGASQKDGWAPSSETEMNILDRETVYVVANGSDALNLGENLIDYTKEPFVITSRTTSNHNTSTWWYSTPFVVDGKNIPDNTPLSCQMRIKFEGCSNLNSRDTFLYLSNTSLGRYPRLAVSNPDENGTFEIKHENFTIDSSGEGWSNAINFAWSRTNSTDITFDDENSKIIIDRVKLELGPKCTAWSLSENDKIGKDSSYGTTFSVLRDSMFALVRDNLYSEAQWKDWCRVGRQNESWSKRDGDASFSHFKVGDNFIIVGYSTSRIGHIAIFQCTKVSDSKVIGDCTAHFIEGDGSNIIPPFLYDHTVKWVLSTSTTTPPESAAWNTTRPVPTSDNKYLWQKDIYEYTESKKYRNLMRGTANLKTVAGTTVNIQTSWKNGAVYISGAANGSIEADTTQTFPTELADMVSCIKITSNETITSNGPGFAQGEISLDQGNITMSCWVKGAAGTKFKMQAAWDQASQSGTGLTNDLIIGEAYDNVWQKVTVVGNITSTSSRWCVGYVYLHTAASTLYVAGLKVEYGNVAVDDCNWTKAPEDYNREETRIVEVAGTNGISVSLDNPNIIFTQPYDSDTSTAAKTVSGITGNGTVSVIVVDGNSVVSSSNYTVTKNPNTTANYSNIGYNYVTVNSNKTITLNPAGIAVTEIDGRYYPKSEGFAKITVGYKGVNYVLTINFVVNVLGQIHTTVNGDIETTIANKTYYEYNPATGAYDKATTMGEFIRSSSENTSILDEQINNSTTGLEHKYSVISQNVNNISLKVGQYYNLFYNAFFGELLADRSPYNDHTSISLASGGTYGGKVIRMGGGYFSNSITSSVMGSDTKGYGVYLDKGTYTFQMYARVSNDYSSSSSAFAGVQLLWDDNADFSTWSSSKILYGIKVTGTSYSRYTYTFTLSSARYVGFRMILSSFSITSPAFNLYIDAVMLEIGSTASSMISSYGGYQSGADVGKVRNSLLATGIDIEKGKITMTADKFECQNNSGVKTAWLDDMGNFTIRGVYNNLITVINSSNWDKYIIKISSGTYSKWYLDVLLCGTFVVIESLPSDVVSEFNAASDGMLHLPYYANDNYFTKGYTRYLDKSTSTPRLMTADELRMLAGRKMVIKWNAITGISNNRSLGYVFRPEVYYGSTTITTDRLNDRLRDLYAGERHCISINSSNISTVNRSPVLYVSQTFFMSFNLVKFHSDQSAPNYSWGYIWMADKDSGAAAKDDINW